MRIVLDALEQVAPTRFAFEWDKVGLQVGDRDASVSKAVVSLDRSLGAVEFAKAQGADLLLAHHPLIFAPLARVDRSSHVGKTVVELIRANIQFVAAHTNWDAARGGVNDALAALLGLSDLKDFGSSASAEDLKLVVYAPQDSTDAILDALSEAGAGVIGTYKRCAFTLEGNGTFEASTDSNPTVGEAGERSTVEESRIEMVVGAAIRDRVERALRKVHPYETPAYEFLRQASQRLQPAGRIGVLPEATPLRDLVTRVDRALETRSLAWGDPQKKPKKVAVVGGAADSEWMAAQRAGADVLITGEVKQHVAVEASESGMAILASGHYATEQPGVEALRDAMASKVEAVEWVVFRPQEGFAGRPTW